MWYLSCVVFLTLPATDCLFCCLGSAATVQFKLLAHRLRNIVSTKSEKEMWTELQNLVDYHNFLLNYCQELNSVFRGVFLLQFIISTASASVSVFIFMQPGDWRNRMKFMLYFIVLIIETGFYCVPIEILIKTAQEITSAVYDSKWYEIHRNRFKKCLPLVIGRAQKPMIFSGFGLINMNLGTYVLICKTVFSFYTYLNSVQKLAKKLE